MYVVTERNFAVDSTSVIITKTREEAIERANHLIKWWMDSCNIKNGEKYGYFEEEVETGTDITDTPYLYIPETCGINVTAVDFGEKAEI